MPREELLAYASTVLRRFSNPLLQHRWRDIALNGLSKYRVRLLPHLVAQTEITGRPPGRNQKVGAPTSDRPSIKTEVASRAFVTRISGGCALKFRKLYYIANGDFRISRTSLTADSRVRTFTPPFAG